MGNVFIQDVNEPKELIRLLSPAVPLEVHALNVGGFADYQWAKHNGRLRQVERKTWGELLSNVDKVEEQLQRHLTKNSDIELVFMLEGIPVQGSVGINLLNSAANGKMFIPGRNYNNKLSGIYSWLFEITNYLTVVQTSSLTESAIALTAMYNHDQKDSHNTLRRHIKQVASSPNPMVTTLMGASVGLGDKRAADLIARVGTPWRVWSAGWKGDTDVEISTLTDISGIGPTIVNNILRSIGRPDV